ncbi:uncharacterized protein LOC110980023 [Acanthaster planci]|uniref:Uncharacterized protein LOC110980023 n=1 Tax=Acanthaster planci TaxID=133434 RepID=A0A8B7YFH3_ACAPL|nr:uncharacterized protein LOC110980023 [Acanthaster planci]
MTGRIMAQCNTFQCVIITNTISSTVDSNATDECYDNGTIITVSCNRGFQNLVDKYNTVCNGTTGEFEPGGSCEIDLLTLILAIVLMLVITFIFSLVTFLAYKRYTKRWKKAMYDTSRDVSEIIDGHNEEVGGVVNIGMATMPPSPKFIPIEDPYDIRNDVGTQTMAEVHYENSSVAAKNQEVQYANTSYEMDTGSIKENGMLPSDPQAGNSTEKLIDTKRDEPDGQPSIVNAYANIDRPLNRARRGPSDASVGGSTKVRPVTAPPVFDDMSASVRTPRDSDEVEALYAKVNKVKRSSERWPPQSKDPSRPHGRPADLDDLLNHINKPSQKQLQKNESSPTRPMAESKRIEDLYAEVPEDWASGSVKASPPKTAPKPVRNSNQTSTEKPLKRYVPQSQIGDGNTADMYAEVDRSHTSPNRHIVSSNFNPPSPPPIDGTEGLYAQIDSDGKSRSTRVTGDLDSTYSTDEGFVDHATTKF